MIPPRRKKPSLSMFGVYTSDSPRIHLYAPNPHPLGAYPTRFLLSGPHPGHTLSPRVVSSTSQEALVSPRNCPTARSVAKKKQRRDTRFAARTWLVPKLHAECHYFSPSLLLRLSLSFVICSLLITAFLFSLHFDLCPLLVVSAPFFLLCNCINPLLSAISDQ